jgi:4-oxalocrotonate tautomerase
MPTINIELLEGRTDEQKRNLVAKVTAAACQTLDIEAETVNIRIWELKRNATARGGRFLSEPAKIDATGGQSGNGGERLG